jgi:hypothetical protein
MLRGPVFAIVLVLSMALAASGQQSTCNLPQTNRVDCWPQGNVNQTQCENKGCCWYPTEKSSASNGIPWCVQALPAIVALCSN